jgi:PAS domain S-box-containing protein
VERHSRAQRLGHSGDWEWDIVTGQGRWSDEVYRIYGVDRSFSITVDAIADMVHPDERARELARTQTMLDDPERRSGSLQFRIVRPDGIVRHILQTLAIERDDEGKALRAFGLQQDVTELRETEEALVESEHRLRRIYDAGLVGVAFWTADGGIADANDRYLEMLGYTRAELEAGSIDWAAITPPEWAERDRESLEELRATGRNAVPFAKEYYRKDGSRLPILTAAAAFDEEGTSGIGLVVDISEQKRAEAELRRLNLQLEDHVRRRTADLEAANAELESFSYSVSHDLRAPLRHISGFSELLREQLREGDDETRHFLDRIQQASADMSVLIDDLLQFSRVGRAEMHVERVDMAALVDDVLEVQRSDLDGRRVDVSVGDLPAVMGDRVLLRQVWANLLDNAFKYTRLRDPASVEVGSREDGGETVYWVRDDGVGFDMLYVDRLFRVFERLHRTEEFEGTGIGLANVGRIVGRHGGRCGAEAVQGEGATFWFSLPRAG